MDKILSDIFPKRLADARKKAGYNTQEAFADMYDKKYNNGEKSVLGSVKKWERGAAIPKADSLLNICELLNCSADYLLGRQNVQYNSNINAHEKTGFDDIELENIARLKADKELLNIVTSDKCTGYDVLCSLIRTRTGIRLLDEIAYRITRISEYPKCEKVLTSDYAGRGNWLIPVEDLRRSDDMQLFYNILNWVNNHNTAQIYESEFENYNT